MFIHPSTVVKARFPNYTSLDCITNISTIRQNVINQGHTYLAILFCFASIPDESLFTAR